MANAAIASWKKRETKFSDALCGREFSVVSYNTLADVHTQTADNPHCKKEFLFRKNNGNSERHRILLEETIELSQVIEDLLSDDEVKEQLNGVYRTGHVLAVACIKSVDEDYCCVIGNVHTQWTEWRYPVHIALQIAVSVQALEKVSVSIQSKLQTSGMQVPYILCGDFNLEPHLPFHKLLSTGTLDSKDVEDLVSYDHINQYPGTKLPDKVPQSEHHLLEVLRKNFLGTLMPLQSAYKQVLGKEPSYTCVPHLVRQGMTLDYIWFPPKAIKAVAVLDVPEISSLDPPGAIPSEHYPSDHLSLKAWMKLDFQ